MSDSRAQHACDRIKRNGRDYLVVVGGLYGPNMTATNSIELYDLTLRPSSWETIPEIPSPLPVGPIYGSKITIFDEGICEAFFLRAADGISFICKGNYTWIALKVPNVHFEGGPFIFPTVDANILGGDLVW